MVEDWEWSSMLEPDSCDCWSGTGYDFSCKEHCDRGWYYSPPPEWWDTVPTTGSHNVFLTISLDWSAFCDMAYFAVTGEGRLKKEEVADRGDREPGGGD